MHRLNLQYPFFLKHLHKNRLIHDSSIVLPPHAVLLDSGTGTGEREIAFPAYSNDRGGIIRIVDDGFS